MSKALLTVFMDKKARKTLYAVRTAKDMPAVPSKVDPIVNVAHADSKLPGNMEHDEITALIRESLEAAKKEDIDKKKKTINKSIITDVSQSRQDLIENALIIFKSKSHIIDELPEEQQMKLKALAYHVFGEQLKGN